LASKHRAKNSKHQIPKKLQFPNTKRAAWATAGAWDLGLRALMRALFPRIGFRDNQADRVLIESFEAAFALQILQMTHDRPSPLNAFVG
jgi:hypothetical protein